VDTWDYIKGVFVSTWTGIRHFFHPRMTLRYPEQKLDLEGTGYKYDARQGVGLAGFKGRHLLLFEKCTGCQLCAIACDGVAVAIDMQKVTKGKPQNKKEIWPAVDYGRCVPPSTPIVTISGIKPMSDIRIGDRVLTHTGKFQRVTKLFSRSYTGKLYTFRALGNPEPLTTTEDHPILVHESGELTWSFASEIKQGTFLTRPILPTRISNRLGLDPGLYANQSNLGTLVALNVTEESQSEGGIQISRVASVEISEVESFLVQNLEIEGDNSYVAANQSVHNCVFCGLCLEPDTDIITNPGLKQLDQLAIGDMVLTHKGEYKPISKLWDMRYSGPYYRISVFGKPGFLACTADHSIIAVSRPVSRRKDKRLLRVTTPLGFHKPGELKPGDYLVSPIVRKVIHTERYERDVPMYRGGKTTRRQSFETSPELFRLIGYYYAEGSCDGGRRVNFDFNVTERETYAKDCGDLAFKFFGKQAKVRKNGQHGIRLVLDSAMAEDFFSQFGKGAPNKAMPDWIFFAEPEKQLELVKGEWQGDGCRVRQARQKYLNITTTSKTLAFQLQSVYARLGIVATIDTEQSPDRLRSYHVNVFGRWAIKLAKLWGITFDYNPTKHTDKFHIDYRYVYLPIRKIEVEEVRDHRVMDVTVEGDHTFAPLGIATSNCVDACPFDALVMTNDYELSAYDKMALKYTPDMLAVPPKLEGKKYKVEFDTEKGVVKYG
jgi:formate hydrogenlyase subunit 6/NADH:ubiquinone oxidoreductase subunit I